MYILVAIGCVLHFSLITANNLAAIFCNKIGTAPLTRLLPLYQDLAGINGGYSFYGPNVNNQVEIRYSIYRGREVSITSEPRLQSSMGILRFQSYLELGTSFFDPQKRDLHKQAKKTAQVLTRGLMADKSVDSIRCQLLSRMIPPLVAAKTSISAKTTYIILLDHLEINSNDK